MLQVARVCTRTHTLLVCHPPPWSSASRRRDLPTRGLQNHLGVIKEELHKPFLLRHFSSANACGNPPFRSLYRLHSTSIDNVGFIGKRLGQILGLLAGSSYLSGKQGLANIANCENDHDNRWPSPGEEGRIYQQSRIRRVVKRLWVPSLCVLTIPLGWHYPLSLVLNLLFLMWSTKPSPSSIYLWVEQAAGVMHVEVRDNMLFCLARVTSLTKRSTLLGFLGDWWVIYSLRCDVKKSCYQQGIICLPNSDKVFNAKASCLNELSLFPFQTYEGVHRRGQNDGILQLQWSQKNSTAGEAYTIACYHIYVSPAVEFFCDH